MTKTITGIPVAIALSALLLTGCNRQETTVTGTNTATIAPASPQPDLTGTDALTQTVDIESGRTDAEGAGITNPGTATDATVGTTTSTTTGTGIPPTATTTR